jgi:hypothetical protein
LARVSRLNFANLATALYVNCVFAIFYTHNIVFHHEN